MEIKEKSLITKIVGELSRQDFNKILVDLGAIPKDWQFYSIKLKVIGSYEESLRFEASKTESNIL